MKLKARSSELSNHEFVVLALYLVGGASASVDTEDVAIQVNQMAPGKFTWRKHKDQINLDAVRVFLSDAKKDKNGRMVAGSGRDGWRLTQEGLAFAKAAAKQRTTRVRRAQRSLPREKTWLRAERKRLLGTDACITARNDGVESVTRRMAEEFFRVDDYVTGELRERKILRILDAFGDDPDLGKLAHTLATKVNER